MVERQSFETTASFAFIASSASDSGSWTWLCARSLVDVARPKGKRPHFVEPTLVQSKMLNDRVGYLKVAMFPGMLGVDVSNARSSAVAELRNVERLTGNRRQSKSANDPQGTRSASLQDATDARRAEPDAREISGTAAVHSSASSRFAKLR